MPQKTFRGVLRHVLCECNTTIPNSQTIFVVFQKFCFPGSQLVNRPQDCRRLLVIKHVLTQAVELLTTYLPESFVC